MCPGTEVSIKRSVQGQNVEWVECLLRDRIDRAHYVMNVESEALW